MNIKLRSIFNKRCIPITAGVVRQSKVVREKLEARKLNDNENPVNKEDNIITINLRGNALEKIIQWCDHHKDDLEEEGDYIMEPRAVLIDDIPYWDKQFFQLYNLRLLVELICSARQLKIQKMWRYATKTYGMIMLSTTPDTMFRLWKLDYDDEKGSAKAA